MFICKHLGNPYVSDTFCSLTGKDINLHRHVDSWSGQTLEFAVQAKRLGKIIMPCIICQGIGVQFPAFCPALQPLHCTAIYIYVHTCIYICTGHVWDSVCMILALNTHKAETG